MGHPEHRIKIFVQNASAHLRRKKTRCMAYRNRICQTINVDCAMLNCNRG